uniref:G-protein coupled receptors family 1 profile domain-containing protein n=1 Tax=Magallana gigas TaxID=29159 RepID=A0A8W8HM68_MAGGI
MDVPYWNWDAFKFSMKCGYFSQQVGRMSEKGVTASFLSIPATRTEVHQKRITPGRPRQCFDLPGNYRRALTAVLCDMCDLLIMVFGIPETILFMLDQGWLFNRTACKVNRYVMVTSLYGSVLTLIALCVERYVAIIHPIKAHIVCNKRRIVFVLGCIWPCACLAGLPTLLFNEVVQGDPTLPVFYCMIIFPDDHMFYFVIFKYIESALFYFLPLVIQVTLYVFVTKHLFVGSERLHRRVTIRLVNGSSLERFSEALQARRGVVKMLISSVVVYFLSYLPHQVLLISNTISPQTFHKNFAFQVFVMIVANVNSAANPVLYSIFSQNFRQCFKFIICRCCRTKHHHHHHQMKPPRQPTLTSNTSRIWRHASYASATTEM